MHNHLTLVVVLLMATCAANGQAGGRGNGEQAKAQLLEHARAYMNDYSTGNADARSARLSDDVIQVASNGKRGVGKAAVLETFAESMAFLKEKITDLKVTYTPIEVRVLGRGGLVHGMIDIQGQVRRGDKWTPVRNMVWSELLFRRASGAKWLVVGEFSTKADPESIKATLESRTAEQTKEIEETSKGQFSGIGVEIGCVPEGIKIKKVLAGGARDAGIQAGDVLVEIAGQAAAGMPALQAAKLLKGPKDSTVAVKVRSSDGRQRQVVITRGLVVVTGAVSKMLPAGTQIIRIYAFTGKTGESVRVALKQAAEQKATGIVLDMRGSNNGSPQAILAVAELFIPEGRVVWYYKPNGGRLNPALTGQPAECQLPVAVLIDEKTTAGEVLASALRRQTGAVVIGRPTIGATRNKRLEKLPDGSSKLIVIGSYLTAGKEMITGKGITPDVALPEAAGDGEYLARAHAALASQ